MLDRVISDSGYPVAWMIAPNGTTFNQVFQNKQALIDALPQLDQANVAVYFSVGTATVNRTKEVRVESNIHSFKSLWMDIDIEAGNPLKYATISEASTGLKQFCDATGWTLPMIVASGTGLHFYWPLLQEITVAIWRDYLPYLLATARHLNLKLDVAASNKATQVMRPAGTTHRKDPANPQKVKVVRDTQPVDYNELLEKLVTYVNANQLPLTEVKSNTSNAFATMMAAAGFTYNPPVEDLAHSAMVTGCAQIRRAMSEDLPEPVWRGVISTAMLFPNGREFAHLLSRNDSRYDYDETEFKLNQLPQPPLPYTCDSFDQLTNGICDSCPHRGKIKSPIVLGKKVETQTVETSTPAAVEAQAVVSNLQGLLAPVAAASSAMANLVTQAGAYKTDAAGCWFIPHSDSGEAPTLICEQQVLPLQHLYRVNADGNREHLYLFRIETAPEVHNDVVIAGDVAHSEHVFKEFTRYGVVIPKKADFDKFGNFMRAHIKNLVNTKPTEMVKTLGWQPEGEFVTGLWSVPPDGQPIRAVLGQEAADTASDNGMQPVGDYATWRAAMDVFNTKHQLHAQMGVCSAYAAPLFEFLTIEGMIFALHGKSGVGKSAVQNAAASVWGNPKSLKTKATGTGTGESIISVMRLLGVNKNMPLVLEELTNLKSEDMSSFIHAIAGGKEKSRLRGAARGEYHRSKGLEWNTVAFSSANDSITDKLAEAKSDHLAERFRVFEITNLKTIKSDSYAEDDRKLKELEANYGHAGLHYAKWMQANVASIPIWIEERINWVRNKVTARPEERFWVQAMAAWLVGIELSHAAGLHSFDIVQLEQYIITQFEAQRESIAGSRESSATHFAEMLNDMLPHALIVDTTNKLLPEGMAAQLPKSGKLHMRIDVSDGSGEVTVSEVKRWCKHKGVGLSVMHQSGLASGLIQDVQGKRCSIGRGVKGWNARVSAYEFKLPPGNLTLIKEKLKEGERGERGERDE